MRRMLLSATWRRPVCASAAALLLAAGLGGHRAVPGSGAPQVDRWRLADTALSSRGALRLGRTAWEGGQVVASTGEAVDVRVSAAYADPAAPQRWADYFASLVHGGELALVHVYVAPPAEVAGLCGGDDVLGCYGADRIVMPGEPVDGIAPESVAAHEYGHHVAANRVNSPWSALDWGPKHWATYESVCARVRAGTAFPGDESLFYKLNPGEAFAESYRLMSEQAGSAGATAWTIVSPSFLPDAAALEAVREDVLDPWRQPAPVVVRARFAEGGARSWTLPLAPPLDGQLSVTLTLPRDAGYDLALLGPDGQRLASGYLSSGTTKSLEYAICGEHRLRLRVARHGRAAAFSVRIQQP
jgi:hypothetical protein